jgi:AcrR family transcriptional regulator
MATHRGLTRDQILDAALEIADADGLPAVSMRSVAQRLDVTPMALYRHVGDKDALLDGLVERLLLEVGHAPDGLHGTQYLHARAAAIRAAARRHPAAFGLLLARRAVTPVAVRARDAVLAALAEAGVPADDTPRLERVLSSFVLGFAASEASGRFTDAERADADFGYAEGLLTTLIELAAQPHKSC